MPKISILKSLIKVYIGTIEWLVRLHKLPQIAQFYFFRLFKSNKCWTFVFFPIFLKLRTSILLSCQIFSFFFHNFQSPFLDFLIMIHQILMLVNTFYAFFLVFLKVVFLQRQLKARTCSPYLDIVFPQPCYYPSPLLIHVF